MKTLYRSLLAPIGLLIYFLLALPFSRKAKDIFKLRKESYNNRPDFLQGCYWIHASSGEFEYAKAVIREIKQNEPSAKIVATYSSPSYAKSISGFDGVDHAEPLPFDIQAPIKEFISHYQPKMLLIARTDLWPEILWQCGKNNIPRVLFSCSFPKQNKGLGLKWKSYLYNFLDYIFVIKDSDKTVLTNNFKLTHPQISVIGDTRIDQVLFRLSQSPIPKRDDSRICFLAGSTWQEDESVIIPALAPLIEQNKLQLILVPHEPTKDHIKKTTKLLNDHKLTYELYSNSNYNFETPVLIVDKIGVLASLYPLADLSFVGGSFKSEVHSVMESLGAGCLTCLGPYYRNNREAVDFSQMQVTPHWNMVNVVQNAQGLRELATDVVQNDYELDDVEAQILAEVQVRQGASQKLFSEIERIQNV